MIGYGKQTIGKEEIEKIIEVLKSPWLTQGPLVEEFENNMAEFCQVKYACAVSSGTAALHLACLTAGIGDGDEVITTPMSFAATANSVLYCRGIPVFCDIKESWPVLDLNLLSKKITKKTKAVISVDYGGLPENYEELNHICRKYGLIHISDAAHSVGAEYHGKRIGSLADLTIFSFHPVKTITTGEGGMILTDDIKYNHLLKKLRTHGMEKNHEMLVQQGPWYYEMRELGYNYRMTDIQSAMGLAQLDKIQEFLHKRKEIADYYTQSFSHIPEIILPETLPDRKNAWHIYPLRIRFQSLIKDKVDFYHFMMNNEIRLQTHYIPINRHPYYQGLGYHAEDTPFADLFYQQEVSLPLYPDLSEKNRIKVVRLVKEFIRCSRKDIRKEKM